MRNLQACLRQITPKLNWQMQQQNTVVGGRQTIAREIRGK